MKLNPEPFGDIQWNEDTEVPYIQRTLALVGKAFVRIHRIGAPPPGLNRIFVDGKDDQRLTFVLVHGIGLSSTYMLPLAQELSQLGEVMLLDLPGFGDVPPPDRELTISGFGAIVDGVCRMNGIEDPILVGHSMGAQIVVELMARNPDKYRRGCLIGPPVNMNERTAAKVLLRYIESSLYERPDLVRVAVWSYLRSVKTWFFQILPSLLAYPIEERMEALSADTQTLILYGEHDHLVPQVWADFLATRAGKSRAYMVPEVAHSTLYNADDDVAFLIKTLLTDEERAGIGKKHW